MPGANTTWVQRWFEQVWNEGDANAIDNLMTADAVMHGLGEAGREMPGSAPFKEFAARFRGAFPDVRITVDATVEEGDMIAARWTAMMTHLGDDLGIPATGRPVTVTGMSMARLRDGLMVEGWNNWDTMALMQQIGAPPASVALVE